MPGDLDRAFPWLKGVHEKRRARLPAVDPDDVNLGTALSLLMDWKACPWQGQWRRRAWWPRRAYYEQIVRLTGPGLPDSPEAYEAWFQKHPFLYWDTRLQRLTDQP